jgi:hypothetical protein
VTLASISTWQVTIASNDLASDNEHTASDNCFRWHVARTAPRDPEPSEIPPRESSHGKGVEGGGRGTHVIPPGESYPS